MRAYLSLFRVRFLALLQYRSAALAGVTTQLFWGLIKIMVLEAFYRNAKTPPPMSFAEIVTYTWLGQAFLHILPLNANPDPDVRNAIRTGAVAYELTRPLDLYNHWYIRQIAARSAPTLLRAVPQFLIAVPFLGLTLPPSWEAFGTFAVSLAMAVLLSSAFLTLITVSLLWTIAGDGVARISTSIVLLLSGLIIPLPLFPDFLQQIIHFLPFRGMADAPFRLYMGHLPPGNFGLVLLHQIAWTVVFIALGRWLLERGKRVLVVQGG